MKGEIRLPTPRISAVQYIKMPSLHLFLDSFGWLVQIHI